MAFPISGASSTIQGSLRGAAVTKALSDAFIPELWSTEVKRALDQKFVTKDHVKSFSFVGKKGDRLRIPNIGRAAVNVKLPETPVSLQARNENDWYIDIDQYKESSFLIEDIVNVQSAYNLRSIYTQEAGYALARDLDASVLALRAALNNIPSQVVTNTSDGTLTGTSAPLNYNAILAAKLILDRADVPEEGRVLIVSPTQYNQLLAVDKFISMWYRDEKPVSSGMVGTIFGIPVIMTSMIGANSTTGYFNGSNTTAIPTPGVVGSGAMYLPTQDRYGTGLPTAFGGSNNGNAAVVHSALLCHPEWCALAMMSEPKVEAERLTLYQGDAVVMTQLYGVRLYQSTNAVVIHTNAVLPSVS